MKHITCFITALSSGGAEHQLTILADSLIERGYVVELVTFSDLSDHYLYSDKIKRIRIAKGKNQLFKLLSIFCFFLFHKTDYIISFGYRNNTLALIPLLIRPGVKIIAGERCVLYDKETIYQKLNFEFLYKRATHIVTNSFSQRQDIISKYPDCEKKCRVITNYTDLHKYLPKFHNREGVVTIGIFCRYHPQKNYERFAKAVQMIKQQSKVPFLIKWYGNKKEHDNQNPYYAHFNQLVTEYGIENVLVLNDHVKNVDELIPSFDAMCLPSLVEGFSNSISEYICCGKPVLCSDVADNGIMVHDGVNGFLFDPKDENSMVQAFQTFLSLSREELSKMGQESRKIAESLFDKEKFVNGYIQLIEG